jgi:hypothetical protein
MIVAIAGIGEQSDFSRRILIPEKQVLNTVDVSLHIECGGVQESPD